MSAWTTVHHAPDTILARLWRGLTHPVWLLALLGLGLAMLASHIWLPQLPAGGAGAPFAASAWMSETVASIPGGSLWAALGLFDLAHNTAARVLLALLAAALALRAIDRLQLAWTTQRLAPPERELPTTTTVDTLVPSPDALPAGRLAGYAHRQHTIRTNDDQISEWYGDRNQRFTWAAVLIEAGGLLALAVLLLNLRFGWQVGPISLDPGQSASLEPFSAAIVQLDEGAQTMHLCCDPDQTATVGGGSFGPPGLRVTEQQIGPALVITAMANNQPVAVQAIEQSGTPSTASVLRFPQARSERVVAIPDRNLFLRIVQTGANAFNVQALDAGNNVLLTREINGAAQLALDDLTVYLRPARFVTLGVRSRPWLWLLVPALVLSLAGGFFRWRFPYSRLGARYGAGSLALRWQGQGRPHLNLDDIQ